MVRLEEILRIHPERLPSQTNLSPQLGVNARTLRVYCGHHLGVAPGRYVRLRRLGRIRRGLQDANPGVTIVSALERHHGVNQLGRFAGDYRHLFGELPLRRYDGAEATNRCDLACAPNRADAFLTIYTSPPIR